MEENDIKVIADAFDVPETMVQIKAARLEDRDAVEGEVRADIEVLEKISKECDISLDKVHQDYFATLNAYRDKLMADAGAGKATDDAILRGFDQYESRKYGKGGVYRDAIILNVSKPGKSTNGSTYRTIQMLVRKGLDSDEWEMISPKIWKAIKKVDLEKLHRVQIVKTESGYINLEDIVPSDRPIPDKIPDDPRRRIRVLSVSKPKNFKGTTTPKGGGEGWEYNFNSAFVNLIAQDGDDTELLSASAVDGLIDRWQVAPKDQILFALMTPRKSKGVTYYGLSDWSIADSQDPMPLPRLPTLLAFSDADLEECLGEWVFFDARPIEIEPRDGEYGPYFLMRFASLFGDEATGIMGEDVFMDPSVVEMKKGAYIFKTQRVMVLARVSEGIDQKGKRRIRKNISGLYSVDDVQETSEEYFKRIGTSPPEGENPDDSSADNTPTRVIQQDKPFRPVLDKEESGSTLQEEKDKEEKMLTDPELYDFEEPKEEEL